jgi:iron complex transport system substrate-binding protein
MGALALGRQRLPWQSINFLLCDLWVSAVKIFFQKAKGILFPGLIFLFSLGSAATGWSLDTPKVQTGITVTDFRGKVLRADKPVRRIVCLIESALSGLYMLGEEKRVVGVFRNIYATPVFFYYAAMDSRIKGKQLPAPGNWDFVNLESVVALKPDLVIIWAHQTESIAVLEERGIPVYGVFIKQREDVYREIQDLGLLTGRAARAQELIDYTQKELARFQNRVAAIPQKNRPGVYYMWAQGNLETSCGQSTVNDLIEQAGGRNVCASLPNEHVTVNLETVLSWNPDLIVMWNNEKKDPVDIIRDPQWKRVKAVQDQRVYEFPDIFLCDLWTLKFLYAAKMTAKWTHPTLFRDIDLLKEKRQMLRFFYGPKWPGN